MKAASAHAWFFPTSPRSPYILQEELRLLKGLEGRVWDSQAQYSFAELLARQRGHAISHFKNPAFTARDRVNRGPRMLGFVHLPKRGARTPLVFTAAGNQLLGLEDPSYLYQRQLAKVQFGSPLHNTRGFEAMRIRPMLAVIAVLQQLDNLSKEEMALFVLTTTDYKNINASVERIKLYRNEIRACAPGRERKLYRRSVTDKHLKKVFESDIERGNIFIREGEPRGGLDKFIATKHRNLHDYADATIRYLQASGIFTLSPVTQRLEIARARRDDARFLLDTVGLAPVEYETNGYDDYVQSYLGNPETPYIRRDDTSFQSKDFNSMVAALSYNSIYIENFEKAFSNAATRNERLAVLHSMEEMLAEVNVRRESQNITLDRESALADIKRVYQAISERSGDVIDRPLMYEWNTWRAMVLVNDALEVKGNFRIDVDGNPLTTAPGKTSDIIIEYESFWLIVEVTLQSGYKQYESEGESIVRHVGMFQKERANVGDDRPVYALFVSEKINETVIAYLQSQARFKQQIFNGAVKIVPMGRSILEGIVEAVASKDSYSSEELKGRLDGIFSQQALLQDSEEWKEGVNTWLDMHSTVPC